MIKVYTPYDEMELAMIRSILDGESIPYFVHNDRFGSMKVGPHIPLLNAKTIMVQEGYEDRARELIDDFLKTTQRDGQQTETRYSLWDRMRLLFEFLLFGWIMPGRRWRKRNRSDG